ncbi:MAG: hypothetical protein ACRD5H_09475 [Nitrososphaerales archaeon]
MVDVDPLVLGGLIAAIIGLAISLSISYGKLLARVNHLEKNPLIVAWKEIQGNEAIGAVQKLLDDWRSKK